MTDAPGARPLRILHVFRAPLGGLFRHVLDVARGQTERGHAVGIFCDSSTGGARADEVFRELSARLELGVTRVPMWKRCVGSVSSASNERSGETSISRALPTPFCSMPPTATASCSATTSPLSEAAVAAVRPVSSCVTRSVCERSERSDPSVSCRSSIGPLAFISTATPLTRVAPSKSMVGVPAG